MSSSVYTVEGEDKAEQHQKGDEDGHVDVNDDIIYDQQSAHCVIYRVHDVPPVLMWPVYGMQQALICVSGTLLVPFLIPSYICAGHLPEVRAQLLSITFFMCGVATLLQTIVGVRLPIVQGSSYAFLPPIVAMMNLDTWKCPSPDQELDPDEEEPWKTRIREHPRNNLWGSAEKKSQSAVANSRLQCRASFVKHLLPCLDSTAQEPHPELDPQDHPWSQSSTNSSVVNV